MIRSESRITIAGSVPEVWAYVCDVGRWPEWAPTVRECWVAGRGPARARRAAGAAGEGAVRVHPPPGAERDRGRGAPLAWRSPGRWAPPRRAGEWSSSRWTIGRPTP